MSSHRNQSIDFQSSQLAGFYMMATMFYCKTPFLLEFIRTSKLWSTVLKFKISCNTGGQPTNFESAFGYADFNAAHKILWAAFFADLRISFSPSKHSIHTFSNSLKFLKKSITQYTLFSKHFQFGKHSLICRLAFPCFVAVHLRASLILHGLADIFL